jgi:two-component system, NarL family, sensor kinase
MKQVLFLFLFSINLIIGQQNKKIETLINKHEKCMNTNIDSAYFYINKATQLSSECKNNFLLSSCFYQLSLYYNSKNDSKTAKSYLLKSLILSRKTKNYKTLSFCFNRLGILEMDKGNYDTSLNNLLYALKIATKNNLPENSCFALNNLGNLYDLQNDTVKALEYYKRDEKICLENKLDKNLMDVYASIAVLFQKSEKSETISYYKKSLFIAKKLNDDYKQFLILINLSAFYLYENKSTSNQKALNCLNQAKALALKMKSPINLFYVYFNIGGYYYKIENYDVALENYKKALDLAPSLGNNEQTLNIYKALGDTYKINNQFDKAYVFQEKYHGLKDSIFNIEKSKTFNDIQTKYEVEKKNLKINLLSKEKMIESNKKRNIIYISLIVLLPLILLLLFYKNRIKLQKIINENENIRFNQEKQKLQQDQEIKRMLGLVQGQDEERNRIAQEIHDGVGGSLAGIKLNLSQVNQNIKNESIKAIILQLNGLFTELRAISHNLSSNFIKNKDLSGLLFALQNDYKHRKEFAIELTIYPENSLEHLAENIKHQIYRIVQELLNNVSKHAHAKKVSISLTKHPDSLNLIVEDDGIGFDTTTQKGIGLKNIEERLKTINGTLNIETKTGKGSCFIIDIKN